MKPIAHKATHKGTCQICGSIQMLPSGYLAKHGYTVRWGFFEGVCPGSGGKPFEESTDLIAAAIARVEKDIAATDAEIAAIEDLSNAINNGTDVWHRHFSGGRIGYAWVKVWLHDFATDSTTYRRPLSSCLMSSLRPLFSGRSGRAPAIVTQKIEAYDNAWEMHDVREWARFLNRKYAEQVLKPANDSRRRWLAWQSERVAKWAPAPLIPR